MSRKIAVDVVLLPSDEMTERAIELNRELLEDSNNRIVLNKTDCLPHISLAMGCIEQKDISTISDILEDIAEEYSLGRLRVTDVRIETNSIGQKVSVLTVEKTKPLQSLHERVLEKLKPFFSYDVNEQMILSDKVASTTLSWIKNYPRDSSFENFYPHITIGYGQIDNVQLPLEFNVSNLALCRLGNHCTCRKVLFSTPPGRP